jgi:hypothetical protein
MEAFDSLPPDLRSYIRELDFNILDDHILGGENEMRRVKKLLDAGVKPQFYATGLN